MHGDCVCTLTVATCFPRALGEQVATCCLAALQVATSSHLHPESSWRAESNLLPKSSWRAGGYPSFPRSLGEQVATCFPSSLGEQVATCFLRALTASNAGSDGRIQVYIGCSHPIQTRAPGHRVNQEPIQTRWPNARATEFESVNDSLGGPAPEFESDGRIRYKLGCDHPSQLFWQCLGEQVATCCPRALSKQVATPPSRDLLASR
ncbi:hypothetical protein PCASD_24804 [Puccinia coronata f. sp. avenae]|uniref:Uncharacterized protein n=1 Tax=Puccinia coronata f. sp. avenae TaxID=200324 RepID=A0A2N5S463_9BASI|nr:hypothetical protein PCASD_24804 [Puccinia coronata f. sp. avenae]